jgi:DNA-3-methyladenine glycosylase
MFGKPGLAYIYFVYGNHFCLNVKAETEGVPGAVLIRAVEIIDGHELAYRNRKARSLIELSNGPGKLTEAMNITRIHNGTDLTKLGDLYICNPVENGTFEMVTTIRIRIKVGTERDWRFYIKNNKAVSHVV